MKKLVLIFVVIVFFHSAAFADVVKPALIEITVNSEKMVNIEVRASIEALLTGINAKYKNTKNSPNAFEYDEFRKMSPGNLQQAFAGFQQDFLQKIYLKSDGKRLVLNIVSVDIPLPGYTKVPRISTINITAKLPVRAETLRWYYPEKFGDNAVRVKQVDLDNNQWHWSQWQWLRNNTASELFSLTKIIAHQSTFDVLASYVKIGFAHIVPKGTDHILFIVGLFLLSTRLRPLLWQVTMFTIAHTITLALSMNNVLDLPSNVVEPLIALSIAYVGIENIMTKVLHKSRLVLVFMFGLLHGLGFAGVLSGFGMPSDDFAVALISFNVGVELGQLAVILIAFILLRFWFKEPPIYRKIVVIPGSIAISIIGVYWFLQRLELF